MRPQSLLVTAFAGQALAYPALLPKSLNPRGWPSINAFLSKIEQLFPVDIAVTGACGLIGDGENTLAALFGIPSTENQGCGDVTVVFARGTCDPGNVGVLVGPWLFRSLQSKLSGKVVDVQGVDYPASIEGFLTGAVQPGVQMANQIKSVVQSCPNSKIVLGGYSQGAMVVHNAAADLDAATMSKISAVVLFGDPDNGKPVANIDSSKVKVVCHDGDNICQGGDFILVPHLTYAEDADSAADFIVPLVS